MVLLVSAGASLAQAATPSVCAGFTHNAALRNDGTVFTWGANAAGQLGNGETGNRLSPAQVSGVSGVVDIASGPEHSLVLKSDGTVWAWGSNWGGQLGDGTNQGHSDSRQVNGLADIVAVWAGHGTSAAIGRDGKIYTWGSNYAGQLGDASRSLTGNKPRPSEVPGVGGVAKIWGGVRNVVVMKSDGTVWEWGGYVYANGANTAQTAPTQVKGLANPIQVATGIESARLALLADGTVWAWGSGTIPGTTIALASLPVQLPGISNVKSIAAGFMHYLFLKNDGTVWALGKNSNGQLGDGTTSVRGNAVQVSNLGNVVAIYASYGSSFAVKADGSVWAWGSNGYGELGDAGTKSQPMPEKIGGIEKPLKLSASLNLGEVHSLALAQDGKLWAWGANGSGQLGSNSVISSHAVPARVTGLSNVESIGCGRDFVLAVRSDGTVWGWGYNLSGQLGDGGTVNRLTPVQASGVTKAKTVAGGTEDAYVLQIDGTVWRLGGYFSSEKVSKVDGFPGVREIAGGGGFLVALSGDGTVWTYGNNDYGQLGNDTRAQRFEPAVIPNFDNVTMIAARADHAFALKKDGTVWAWGRNDNGQLGDGTTIDRHSPVQVTGLTNVVALSVGAEEAATGFDNGGYTLALTKDGTVWAWGYNRDGRLGDGTFISKSAPVKVNGLSDIVAISASWWAHSLALKKDGTVWAWGGNNVQGQFGDGTFTNRMVPAIALNEIADGFLDLIPEVPNNIPADKIPAFLMKVTPTTTNTNVLVKYDPQTLSKNGNVYVVGFVKANSPLLQTKTGFSALAPDAVVPVMLTRSGFKQMGAGTAVDPVYSGPLDASNNTFTMYDPASFDNTKDYGIFCIGYATDVGTPSAKGQIRAAVTGQISGAYQCPPLQVAGTASFIATSNDRTEALTINAAIAPKSADIGKPMNVYTWAVAPNGSFFVKKPNGWDVMNTLQLDTNFSATLTNNLAVPIVDNLDLRSLVGTQAYVGYGVSEKDMLDNARYGLVYTIH